jgi:putative pyruvate formate lyase activating enzyme
MQGLVDIYLPDFKYSYAAYSKLYSSAPDYPEIALKAISEMKRQVGDLKLDEEGIATRGLIIRLLVLPNNIAGIQRSLDLIAQNLGPQTQISLMGQYYPTHKAFLYPELSRGISTTEYDKALDAIHAHGFTNVWTQELSCNDEWTPDFRTDGNMVS